jgi:hypothetical protein
VYRAKIFRVNTSLSALSTIKISDLYLSLIKSYESPKVLENVDFSLYLEVHKIRAVQCLGTKILL